MSGNRSITVSAKANQNTLFIRNKSSWLFYLLALVGAYGILSLFHPVLDTHQIWTILHIGHAVVTFIFFHWIKGSPIDDEQGKISDQTWWEQLAHSGARATPKFLIVIPTVLYMLTNLATHDHAGLVVPNLLCYLILMIPKLHRPRKH
ncbi:hypothetical protein J8273_2867 [Carpediemonas membranifera]|uniref:Uncharacterized protein n=1 Tax=Carpediemonas membranifera TaxID=201153 RepID=A0A8J6E399_9EUKA|nr:hypothetical protein J8273_2867 [Carpediemonas membranifera]|eukprot:KAG9395663.1 hypothetical protein J8273_2867 [Carpediemonas membranifera]